MISKLMLLELVTIQEKKQLLLNKGVSNDIIDKLLQTDPTNKDKSDNDKVGSYTDWIVSRYLKDRLFNDFDKLHQLLELYDKSKHKIPDKELQNIGLFKTLDDLITFVNNNLDKLVIKTNDFIVEEKNNYDMFYSRDFIIHVPHTEELSIKLGSGTKWCTSLINNNEFNNYIDKGYLFYLTNKSTHLERYNLFLDEKYDKIEFADDKDRHLTYKLFDIVKEDNTLIPLIEKYVEYKKINLTGLLHKFLDCKTVHDVVLWFKIYINEKASIYFETNEQILIDIVSKVPKLYVYISNPTPLIQLLLVKKDPSVLNYLTHFNKDIQLLLVSHSGYLIADIFNLGITPDGDVQLLLVTTTPHLINILLERHIPVSKKIQLLLVSKHGLLFTNLIFNGVKPDEDVKLLLVNNDWRLIFYITNPNEKIQLLLIKQNWRLITYIMDLGIPLSEKLQLLLIKQNLDLYAYIYDPTPKLTLLYKQLKGIKESTGYISKLLDVN